MKGSLATSAVLHALVITWALVSLGRPESFDVADVMSRIQAGGFTNIGLVTEQKPDR